MDAKSRSLLASQWARAAEVLHIRIVVPANVISPDGVSFEFACLLPDFGAPKGTLLDTTWSREATSVAISFGYTLSTMLAETRLPFEVASYKDCLLDWGWTATDRAPPSWYEDPKGV
jgi:hypothetical protein